MECHSGLRPISRRYSSNRYTELSFPGSFNGTVKSANQNRPGPLPSTCPLKSSGGEHGRTSTPTPPSQLQSRWQRPQCWNNLILAFVSCGRLVLVDRGRS
eukprot:3886364-Rhodomonas_salina.2